ncbi:molybdenum cofactor guanylyltransferase [Cyanobium sp. Morenito 9A2]|uniref:molybdenum cofactor guanylyltransferase n=1 Tax=Cyanobium sp. Morenito 9A2 TaxID=2823718 RepID=UPI0020CBBA62|nr:molybdenum cofactor guanylyltransferase [Cyanobium sp. Morenito 9A2]MCP9850955.1 molybdenum cofactor guanylyltransferase [Cyanobium sp. Morenito 9A2]
MPPLRTCLLSGGESRRMGRDKALLPHQEGGSWLERSLRLLALAGAPITVLSRHPSHLELARAIAPSLAVPLEVLEEPAPWEGPLRALARLMEHHPGALLLLCPVDMPWLDGASLDILCQEAHRDPGQVLVAHDGERLQPLLGIYPADRQQRTSVQAHLALGRRSLQGWLEAVGARSVPLPAAALRNANDPATAAALWP